MIKTVIKWIVVIAAVAGVIWLVTSSGVLDESSDEPEHGTATEDASASGDTEDIAAATSTTQAPPVAGTTTSTTTSSTTSTTIAEDELTAGKGPMHVVIAASEISRKGAEAKAAELEKAVGASTGFTVDLSDHYGGLKSGFWVVIHGAKDRSAAEAVRVRSAKGSFRPYIRSATKTCDDSIAIES